MTLTNMVTRCTVIGIMTVLFKYISVKHIFSVDNLGKAWQLWTLARMTLQSHVCVYIVYMNSLLLLILKVLHVLRECIYDVTYQHISIFNDV